MAKAPTSPYIKDANERAGKTLTYTFASFWLQEWISRMWHFDLIQLAFIAGTAAAVVSLVGSYASRFIGQRDTASLTRTYAYGDAAPAPSKREERYRATRR